MSEYEKQPLVEQPVVTTFKIVFQYIVSDIQKKPRSFKIGLFTIYLVVMFLSLVQSAFKMSSIIFLQLAETSSGDTDFLVTPVSAINDTNSDEQFGPLATENTLISNLTSQFDVLASFRLINTTQVDFITRNMRGVYGQGPRWLITGNLLNPDPQATQITEKMRSFVVAIDSLHEMSIGIGRRWKYGSCANDEAFVTASVLRGLNISEGGRIDLNVNIMDFLFSSNEADDPQYLIDQLRDFLDAQIIQPLRDTFGSGIVDFEINSTELSQLVDVMDEFATTLQDDEAYKNDLRDYLDEQISGASFLDQTQKDNLQDVVDQILEQNMTSLTSDLKAITDSLDPNLIFTLSDIVDDLAPSMVEALNLTLQLRVKAQIDSPKGKWSSALGNVIAVDYKNLTPFVVDTFRQNLVRIFNDSENESRIGRLLLLDPIIDPIYNASLDLNMSDYALSSNFVLNDRVSMYSATDTIKNKVISISNEFYTRIGKNHPSQISTPLADQAQAYLLMSNFLNNLVFAATFLLVMLSMLLIYSLLIGDVEEKTYEFGMLRALGFNKTWLVILLFIEALIFAIPGLCLGLVSAYLFNSLVGNLIFSSSELVSSYQLDYSAVLLGVGLGLFVPLISNIFPIMRALSKTLRDSLDLYHRTIDEISVSVIKLEKLGLSIEQTMTALLLVIMGFVCYYLAPQAFIFQNIALFLAIINIVLIIMIVGFTLIANLLQGPFERLLVTLMLCIYKPDQPLKQIISKNMQGHYRRNSKTTLLYTLALSFLIFAGTGFTLQTIVIEDILRSFTGANMVVFTNDDYGLNEAQLTQFIEIQTKRDPTLIRAYTYSSFPMTQFPGIPKSLISPLSQFPSAAIVLNGVELKLLHSLDQRYYTPDSYDDSITYPLLENGMKDGVSGIYNRQGNIDLPMNADIYDIQSNSAIRDKFNMLNAPNLNNNTDREINIIVPQGYSQQVAMGVSTPAMLKLGSKTFRVKVRHMATKIPGFLFSGYRNIAGRGNGLISMEDFNYILDEFRKNPKLVEGEYGDSKLNFFFEQLPGNLTDGIPKDSLYIMFARPTTLNERIDFANGMRNYFRDEFTLLFDVITLVDDATTTFGYLNIFYIVVAIIAMTLSFFLLLVSFVSNVRENAWEFGVLRAVGLNKSQITRVYIYEALSLIVASGLIGTVVGIVVAIAITIQINLFTELPFTFSFPTGMFLLTFLGGFLTSIFGSYFAVREIRDKSISTILKGLI